MATHAVKSGLEHIIASPHVMEGVCGHTPDAIEAAVDSLNQRLLQEGIPLTIWPGAEIYIHPDLARWYREGRLPTLAGRNTHVLIELPHASLPLYTEQVLFDLMVEGLRPVIAHPERQKDLAQDLPRLTDWVERGVWLQVNAPSLRGRYGRTARRTALRLVEQQLVHCLGSDSHSMRHPPTLLDAKQEICHHRNGKSFLSQLQTNAQAILGETDPRSIGGYGGINGG